MTGNTTKAFLMLHDHQIIIDRLTNEDAGKLLKAIYRYSSEGIKPNFEESPVLAMAFDIFSATIDHNAEQYRKRCEKNRENINKRWANKTSNIYDCIESNTNVYTPIPNKYKDKYKDKRNNNSNIYCPNFEALWAVYPRKTEKAAAYKAYQARLNDGFSEDELLKAVKNYAAQCEKDHREKKYIKQCKTFLGVNTPFTDYMKGDDEGAAGTDAESWPTVEERYARWFNSMSDYGD